MSNYWLISAPADDTCEKTWEAMLALMANAKIQAEIFKFHIPNFKVGTLDQLMSLSEELVKVDSYTGQVAHRVAKCLHEVLDEKTSEKLRVGEEDISTYLSTFKWDTNNYPVGQSLKTITESIVKKMKQVDTDIESKSAEYRQANTKYQDEERMKSGSLFTRNLGDLVKKENFVLDSEHLTTLLVVVPKALYKNWYSSYDTIAQMTVPESTKLIFEDDENGLFTVTLFKTVADEFRFRAAKKQFVVRHFNYNEDQLYDEEVQSKKCRIDRLRLLGQLKRFLKVSFSESFSAWVHVKALRVYVESVLRYGLPVNFQAMLIQPESKSMKRLRENLDKHYAHLDYCEYGATDDNLRYNYCNYQIVVPGIDTDSDSKYYPYVSFDLNIEMLEEKNFRN